jgi:hypothetical protein
MGGCERLRSKRWISRNELFSELQESRDTDILRIFRNMYTRNTLGISVGQVVDIAVPISDVSFSGADGYTAVLSNSTYYTVPETHLSVFLAKKQGDIELKDKYELAKFVLSLDAVSFALRSAFRSPKFVEEAFDTFFRRLEGTIPANWLEVRNDLRLAVVNTGENMKVFNPLAWGQREEPSIDMDDLDF